MFTDLFHLIHSLEHDYKEDRRSTHTDAVAVRLLFG
jgi:hypothetical protein